MRKLSAALALLALLSSGTIAEARGGRTTAENCAADSADPDCPDTPPPPAKAGSAASPGGQSAPAPPRK